MYFFFPPPWPVLPTPPPWFCNNLRPRSFSQREFSFFFDLVISTTAGFDLAGRFSPCSLFFPGKTPASPTHDDWRSLLFGLSPVEEESLCSPLPFPTPPLASFPSFCPVFFSNPSFRHFFVPCEEGRRAPPWYIPPPWEPFFVTLRNPFRVRFTSWLFPLLPGPGAFLLYPSTPFRGFVFFFFCYVWF